MLYNARLVSAAGLGGSEADEYSPILRGCLGIRQFSLKLKNLYFIRVYSMKIAEFSSKWISMEPCCELIHHCDES